MFLCPTFDYLRDVRKAKEERILEKEGSANDLDLMSISSVLIKFNERPR